MTNQDVEEQDEPRKLTINDPVPPEQLEQLEQLQNSWDALTSRNAFLDHEKVQVLSSLKRIKDELDQLFKSILVERGVPPNSIARISKEGLLEVLEQNQGE